MKIGRHVYRAIYKLTPSVKTMGVYLIVSAALAAGKVLIANLILLFQVTGNVGFWPRLCENSALDIITLSEHRCDQ